MEPSNSRSKHVARRNFAVGNSMHVVVPKTSVTWQHSLIYNCVFGFQSNKFRCDLRYKEQELIKGKSRQFFAIALVVALQVQTINEPLLLTVLRILSPATGRISSLKFTRLPTTNGPRLKPRSLSAIVKTRLNPTRIVLFLISVRFGLRHARSKRNREACEWRDGASHERTARCTTTVVRQGIHTII